MRCAGAFSFLRRTDFLSGVPGNQVAVNGRIHGGDVVPVGGDHGPVEEMVCRWLDLEPGRPDHVAAVRVQCVSGRPRRPPPPLRPSTRPAGTCGGSHRTAAMRPYVTRLPWLPSQVPDARGGDHYVVGLEIAMDDAVGVGDLTGVLERLRNRQPTLLEPRRQPFSSTSSRTRKSVPSSSDRSWTAAIWGWLRAVTACASRQESPAAVRVAPDVGREHLDRHGSVEPRIRCRAELSKPAGVYSARCIP